MTPDQQHFLSEGFKAGWGAFKQVVLAAAVGQTPEVYQHELGKFLTLAKYGNGTLPVDPEAVAGSIPGELRVRAMEADVRAASIRREGV